MGIGRREWNLRVDWVLLAAAMTASATGLVLLVRFHMDDGAFATAALGLDRLVWLGVHRLSAVLVAVAAVTHTALHWRSFCRILAAVVTPKPKRRVHSELLLYGVFLVAAMTGLVAWLVLEGASPLFGPVVVGRASATRHPWIDTHNLSALASLLLMAHHVGHRWRFMFPSKRPD